MIKNRIDDVEALRAFAVLAVIIHHASDNLLTWTTTFTSYYYSYIGGWVGVDLFFAISGFVIARSLIPKLNSVDSNIEFFAECLSFWVKRAYRILPSAWIWLLITLILVVTFNNHGIFGTFRDNWQSTLASLLNVMNFHFAEIFGSGGKISNFVYWSLSLEEQFYLLLPIAVLLARKWLIYFVVIAFIYKLCTPTNTPLDMAFRTHSILGGVILAIWSHHPSYQLMEPRFLKNRGGLKLLTIGLLLLLLGSLGADAIKITEWRISLIAIISIILVYIGSYGQNYIIPTNRLLKAILLWAGSRSYALYLTHIPCFFFSRELCLRIMESNPELQSFHNSMVVTIALSLLVITSELNYRLLEIPLRNKGAVVAKGIKNRATTELV